MKKPKQITIKDPEIISAVWQRMEQIRKATGHTANPEDVMKKGVLLYIRDKSFQFQYRAKKKQLFTAVWHRDPHKCRYCFKNLLRKHATIDHLVPRARGGDPIHLMNLGISCFFCNNEKGILTEEEYLTILEARKVLSTQNPQGDDMLDGVSYIDE